MRRLPIQREMSGEAICVLLAEGNPTVLKLLRMAWKVDPNILLNLDLLNLRGAQVFYAFIGFCNGWFPKFKECVLTKNQEMIDYVNQKCPNVEKARAKHPKALV